MVALTDIAYQWEHLGTQLGLKYGKLKEIERNRRGIPMDCMREMLAEWLQSSGGVYNKQTLKTALQKIGKITLYCKHGISIYVMSINFKFIL